VVDLREFTGNASDAVEFYKGDLLKYISECVTRKIMCGY